MHEGTRGSSIDPIFIRTVLKALDPSWIRPWRGNNVIRSIECGGRKNLIAALPGELKLCLEYGGDTTLMVWADVDHDPADCDALKNMFWKEAQGTGVSRADFDQVVFIFAKDRLENWVEFIQTGSTDESQEGPRVLHNRTVADAARTLAGHCLKGAPIANIPPSLEWSCKNWRKLTEKMR